jgi:UDP-N-acetylmuramoyl-L-alanyl-D-glutamate--2,6-diaminopimelate ligase
MMHLLANLVGHDAELPAGANEIRVTGITSDSRAVKPGFLFAALPGTKVDGSEFVSQAFAKGAAAAIVQTGMYRGPGAVIASNNPRQLLSHIAARFSGAQPETVVAVTGTNGKTSVAVFVRQIWARLGFRAASIGTVGVVGPDNVTYLQHTTPDPVELHAIAAQLREDHVKHLAVEASSHGLAQYRLDGLRLTAGAFTNLTRDHLDYHATEEDYLQAKLRLFGELLPQGAGAVINMDAPYAERFLITARARQLNVFEVGWAGKQVRLVELVQEGFEQHLRIVTDQREHRVSLPLAGEFQVSNALVAAGLVIAAGGDEIQAFHALESLTGAPGRLEFIGRKGGGGSVFVDYAHTPDALETALKALKPYAKGKTLVVFGAGGDRDPGKRALMGAAVAKFAGAAIVTDDNPRTENAAKIRRGVLMGIPGAREIGDRAAAILTAIAELGPDDILLIAGKGHEEGQDVGGRVIPFSDQAVARDALKEFADRE